MCAFRTKMTLFVHHELDLLDAASITRNVGLDEVRRDDILDRVSQRKPPLVRGQTIREHPEVMRACAQ